MLPSRGTYFLNLDLAGSGIAHDDVTVSERLVDSFGIATIPVSSFYASDPVTSILRLCFAKADATIDGAIERLGAALAALR